MSIERKIEDVIVNEQHWGMEAQEMLDWDWAIKDHAEYCATGLVNKIIRGQLTVDELRGGVAWANALDSEATAVIAEVDVIGEQDRLELAARRLANKSGRLALKQVGSERKLYVAICSYRQRLRMLHDEQNQGLFRLELKDLDLH